MGEKSLSEQLMETRVGINYYRTLIAKKERRGARVTESIHSALKQALTKEIELSKKLGMGK